jgi:NADH-quinone oxidoreductase subunit A
MSTVWPILLYGVIVLAIVGGMLLASHLLGERHRAPRRDVPYESGVSPSGTARVPYGAPYALVAVFFLLFDLEAAFLFAWAVAFRELGWAGFSVAGLFIVTLGVGLAYVWKEGGLEWTW